MGNKGQQEARILWNRPISSDCFLMGASVRAPILKATPGQFAMIRVKEGGDVFLRRPLSISQFMKSDDGNHTIEFLYKVVGKGTHLLSKKKRDDLLDIIAPLGHGFRYFPKDKKIFLVAGGIGVAPLRFLSRWLLDKGVSSSECVVFLGSRNSNELLCRDEFVDLGFKVVLTTDDGSFGDQCLITDPLEQMVREYPPDLIYACGPMPMISCMSRFVNVLKIPCQVSLETTMACGMGACLGCAVKTTSINDGYAHACIEGPVFNISEIDF